MYDLVDEEDDWSFVVKLHALLELTVNELILVKLAEPALAKMLTDRLNVAFRINMLEELGVLTKDDAKRMRALGKLRNKLVHDVRQTRFKLIALVDTEGKRKEFAENYVDASFAKACDRRCRSS